MPEASNHGIKTTLNWSWNVGGPGRDRTDDLFHAISDTDVEPEDTQ